MWFFVHNETNESKTFQARDQPYCDTSPYNERSLVWELLDLLLLLLFGTLLNWLGYKIF